MAMGEVILEKFLIRLPVKEKFLLQCGAPAFAGVIWSTITCHPTNWIGWETVYHAMNQAALLWTSEQE